jgi:hypothetical protein
VAETPSTWGDWFRYLLPYLLAALMGAGGGAAVTPLCQHTPCQCCHPDGDKPPECCKD